jgi:tRNA U38,U39,U40 pseudouridine synthase TruA
MPRSTPTFRTVDAVEPKISLGWLVLDVRARAFAWGMVRKIVTALREVESGRLELADLSEAARGRRPLALSMAAPDRLVLWETKYPVRWAAKRTGAGPRPDRWLEEGIVSATARARILTELWSSQRVERPPRRKAPSPPP